jgi:hypothetical protein
MSAAARHTRRWGLPIRLRRASEAQLLTWGPVRRPMILCMPVIHWSVIYWLMPEDAVAEGVTTTDLVRVRTSRDFVKAMMNDG